MHPDLLLKNVCWAKYANQLLSLKKNIHVFKVKVNTTFSAIADNNFLSLQEKDKAERFRYEKDKQRFIVSKHYLRQILGIFTNSDPKTIIYSSIGNGKPFINDIEFNISHSNNIVAIAVSETSVGIDVEEVVINFKFEHMLDICFNVEERNFILEGASPLVNFFSLWTRKEALLKATGEGLTDRLEKVPSLTSLVDQNGIAYQLQTFLTPENYTLTIAAMNISTAKMNFWEW